MSYKTIAIFLILFLEIFQPCILNQYSVATDFGENISTINSFTANPDKVKKLSEVKVAILYESITHYKPFNRTIEDIVRVINETKADFIFRCFWRWNPCPVTPEQLKNILLRERCRYTGYYYNHLKEVISVIKTFNPHIILCGAIPTQILHRQRVWNPITGEVIEYPETWEMALNPRKWDIPVEKREFQCWFAKTHLWVPKNLDWHDYDPAKVAAYFPDITNPRFQKLLLSWAYKQIDCGVDAIWIDMLFKQVSLLARITGDENHRAVRESLEAVCKIVDAIHEYGLSKGRYIYVGSWVLRLSSPYKIPKLDFITISPSPKEIFYMYLNETRYDKIIGHVKKLWGDIPIFAFIDWAATTKTPLGVFSQNLTRDQQSEFLRNADRFFQSKNINFIYPVHGGYLGKNATIKAYGRFNIYDSQAPEFDTYKTIVELACRKASQNITESGVVDVIDLRGSDLKTRLLILSLQGIVNREKPFLYVLWESKCVEPTASERWLEYYKSRKWIKGYRVINTYEAIKKYRYCLNGMVIYDPELPATINLAVSLAGVENLIIVHPDMIEELKNLGLKIKYDLRDKFKDNIDVHKWQLKQVFPRCSKSLINLFPTTGNVTMFRVSIIDYVIANRGCSIGLSLEKDFSLIDEYYSEMNKFAIAIGYPEESGLEKTWISLSSKYGLLNVLTTDFSSNFSFHSKIPAEKKYRQEHRFKVKIDSSKIYIAFVALDLRLDVIQDFYYEMWLSSGRGFLPISWWLDTIAIDFCPGIIQYYYETKTPSDYFYSVHVGGRIRPSVFPYLEEYLHRRQEYLNMCSLRVVALNNYDGKNEKIFQLYSEILNVDGFLFFSESKLEEECWFIDDKVWIAPRFTGNPKNLYKALEKYIESNSKRPLFIIAGIELQYYPKIEDIIEVKNKLKDKYGSQIIFCRIDELIGVVKSYREMEKKILGINRLKYIILLIPIIVILISIPLYLKLKGLRSQNRHN